MPSTTSRTPSDFANQSFAIRILNPKGEEVLKTAIKSDEFGGIAGELPLAGDATLGVYQIVLDRPQVGGGSFRVEEYKKPEYEVKVDAPDEPVQLGDKIIATISAKYYFGGAVQQAKVKYKVERRAHDARWYPATRWDWLYGKGYWWFASEYDWYPGFSGWGCLRPIMPWWPREQGPPEIVAQGESLLDADGKLKLTLDTLPAKLLHGNEDHQYSITAEVVDQSRRTIVGTGNVLVARQPFKVHLWLNRGYLQTGDRFEVHAAAHTLAQKPVTGKGTLILYRVTYDPSMKPQEVEAGRWELNPDEAGNISHVLTAAEAGQYRVAYKLTDALGHTQEGGQVFLVRDSGFTGKEFRFNDLEIVLDKQHYNPGEKVRLLLNTNQTDGTIALFIRPTNGVYLPPKIIRLTGKSTVEEIEVVQKDMPNFYVEAVTVAQAKIYSETKNIAVPPEKRIVNVEVLPSAKEYLPGTKGEIQLKLTDLEGKPFTGSTAVTMYDRSVEYISGGSNVPEIKEFFWKWRRDHHPQTRSSLDRGSEVFVKNGDELMQIWSEVENFGGLMAGGGMGGGMMGGGRGIPRGGRGMPMPAAAPMMMKSMARDGAAHQESDNKESGREMDGEAPATSEESESCATPVVRKNFADTASGSPTSKPTAMASPASSHHARKPDRLENPDLVNGSRHESGAGGSGRRHAQEHHGPAAGPSILRGEGRGCHLRNCPQRIRRGTDPRRQPGTRRPDSRTPRQTGAIRHAQGPFPTAGRLAREGRQRRGGDPPRESPGPHRIRCHGSEVSGLRPRDAQDGILYRHRPTGSGQAERKDQDPHGTADR
ncbi:MAG: hypothetical protein U0903_16975 [Planctomycetales bacterium]